MKLVFINRYFHPDHSATSQLVTDLAVHEARRGREVHVVASRQLYDDPGAQLESEERFEGVHIHRVWTSSFGRSRLMGRALDYATFFVAAALRLLALVRAGDIVIAKTDPPLISVIAAWIARRRQARLVNWLQDLFPEVAEKLGMAVLSGPLGAAARSLRNYSLRTATLNVAVGQRMADTVARLEPRARVAVIENWADGDAVRPVDSHANPLRERWGLLGRFVVGYSGNMGRAHEFQTILAAAGSLQAEPEVVFLFVGAGKQRAWIEAQAACCPNIQFRSYQPRAALAQSLSVPDVHLVTLHPALEGLVVPSKFYGVAAAGRPTLFIGDPDGEIARLVAREGCGVTVRSGDAGGLADAIRRLRDDPAEARAMGEKARSAFDRQWDFRMARERWDEVLRL